jgi:hypothetical protein
MLGTCLVTALRLMTSLVMAGVPASTVVAEVTVPANALAAVRAVAAGEICVATAAMKLGTLPWIVQARLEDTSV